VITPTTGKIPLWSVFSVPSTIISLVGDNTNHRETKKEIPLIQKIPAESREIAILEILYVL